MEPDSQSSESSSEPASDPGEASRQALYRRLEGFDELDDSEPLVFRGASAPPATYWRLGPGLYLRKPALPRAQLLMLVMAVLLLLALWPVTLRLLLALRLLILPLAAVLLIVWLRRIWPRTP